MNKNIIIATSGHPPYDERIFYKFAKTLMNYSCQVTIICSTLEINKIDNGIRLIGFDGSGISKQEKINTFYELFIQEKPDIIICCELLPILSAYKYKKHVNNRMKIISDITEWVPGHSILKQTGIYKYFEYLKVFLFNIYASNLADALVIGEITKVRRYKLIAPFKRKTIIGYYPVLEYFHYSPPPFNGKVLTLAYAGIITFERGILILLDAAEKLAEKYPEIEIRLKILGKFQNPDEEAIFHKKLKDDIFMKRCHLSLHDWVDYTKISEVLSDADICFDLRKLTFIYRNSLPIKIFEYLACGKPIIYSDIKPIRLEMDIDEFGYLVNPEDINEIVEKVEGYIKNPSLLKQHSGNARKAVEEKFNWQMLETKLISIIENLV